jgi:hypothetical protein
MLRKKVNENHRQELNWNSFTCFIAYVTGYESFSKWLILMKPRYGFVQPFRDTHNRIKSPNKNCQPPREMAGAGDKFAFPLNLAPMLNSVVCILNSLHCNFSRFSFSLVLDIWQNMHRDWTDKWFCAIAIFIYSLFCSDIRMQTQFC